MTIITKAPESVPIEQRTEIHTGVALTGIAIYSPITAVGLGAIYLVGSFSISFMQDMLVLREAAQKAKTAFEQEDGDLVITVEERRAARRMVKRGQIAFACIQVIRNPFKPFFRCFTSYRLRNPNQS